MFRGVTNLFPHKHFFCHEHFFRHHHIFPVAILLKQCRLGPMFKPTGRSFDVSIRPSRRSRSLARTGITLTCSSASPKTLSYLTDISTWSSATVSLARSTGHSIRCRCVSSAVSLHCRGHCVLTDEDTSCIAECSCSCN